LLQDIQDQNVLFSIADTSYDSQYIYEIAGTCDIFAVNPMNPCNSEQIKNTHRRVVSDFLQTALLVWTKSLSIACSASFYDS